MRILMIGNAYPTERQVCAVWMKRMAEQIIAQGHDLDLLVICGMPSNRWHRLWQYLVFYLRLALKQFSKYDCVYVHQASHCFLPLLGRSFHGARLVVHIHGTDLLPAKLGFKGRLTRALTLHACRRANLVVVPSEYFAEKLRSHVRPRRLHVYPSGGIDTSRFLPSEESAEADETLLHIGCVGHLVTEKRTDVLIEAIALLSLSCRVTIVGDGPERSNLQDLVSTLQLSDKVQLLGALPAEGVPKYMQSLDVFVFPTTRLAESLGLVALEAMGCGVPVIGSRIGALPEYIEHGKNGYLFEPGDAFALAETLELFSRLGDKERDNLRLNARRKATSYDGNTCTQRLLDVFQALNREAAGSRCSEILPGKPSRRGARAGCRNLSERGSLCGS